MAELILDVEGMTCNHCVQTVEKALTKLPGIERSLVDLEKGQVHIEYDANRVNEDKMKQAVEISGYRGFH